MCCKLSQINISQFLRNNSTYKRISLFSTTYLSGVKDITDLEVEFLISEYDKDGDDELDFIEFKAFMMDDISDTRTFSTRPVDNVKPSATEDAEEIKPY